MRSFATDKREVDFFEPQIKRILGEHLIATADFERDAKQATDLLVLRLEPISIACRIRDWSYTANYGDEFTVRASRPSGAKTELRKIYEGWCQYSFYGFKFGEQIVRWNIYDLDAFRQQIMTMPYKGIPFVREHLQANDDGSSKFAAFRWDEFKPDIRVSYREPETVPCPSPDCWQGKVKGVWNMCQSCKGVGTVPA